MARKGKRQKSQFDVKPGMVFDMQAMKFIHPNGEVIGAGYHPWLILNVEDDYVETVMCKTLSCNNENKHKMYKARKYDNVEQISNSCPPMESDDTRKGAINMDTFLMIPKKQFFSKVIQVWNQNTEERNFKTEGLKSLCLESKEVKRLKKETMNYLYKHPEVNYDPYECEYNEEQIYKLLHGEQVDSSFTAEMYERNFKYDNLPKANPAFLLPYEDCLNPYEKKDKNLLHAINPEKYPKPLSRKDVEQNNALIADLQSTTGAEFAYS